MADTSNLSNFLGDVADAIREKREIEYRIKPENFDIEILAIQAGSGGDTADATATADDVLAPKTFYAGNKKQVGSIELEYGSNSTDIVRTKIAPIKTAVCDYRDDLGYYLVVNTGNNTVEIYTIKHNELVRTLNANSSLTSNNVTSALTIRNAKFSKLPVQDTIYNICVSAGNYANGKGYDMTGLGVARFDTMEPSAELEQFSYYHQDGSNYNTSNCLRGSGLVESNNYVYSTIHSTSNYYQSSKGHTRLYYIDNDENRIQLKYSYDPGWENGHIPYMTDDCRFVCMMNDSICRILKFNDARTSASVLAAYTINSTLHRCIVTNNGVIYNKQYITNDGTVHTYDTLPFGYNDTVIYNNGCLLQFISGTNKVTVYKLNSSTYEITAYRNITFDTAYTISYVGENGYVNMTNYPLFNCDGTSVYTPSTSYWLKDTSESNTILSANIKGTMLRNTDLVTITPDKVLEGNTFVNNTGSHTGTIPNNGTLNYEPSTENQTIPLGYTSGGTVKAVDASIDENILPENIKQGVSILGIEGELTPGAGDATSDANLQARYLLEGYSMVEDGILVEGTMKNYATRTMDYTGEEQVIPTGYYDLLTVPIAEAPNLDGYKECLTALEGIMYDIDVTYTELEYAKLVIGDSIDLDVKCKDSLKWQTKFSFAESTGGCYFGGKGSGESNSFRLFTASSPSKWYLDYGSGEGYNRIYGSSAATNTAYNLEIGNRYIKNLDTGGNILSGSTVSFAEKSYNFMISDGNEQLTIYYLKLYDGDELIRDLVPMKRSTDSMVGFYDKVNDKFYISATGNSLIGGKEIVPYIELNYIENSGRAYIDTDYIPKTAHTKYDLEFMRLSANGSYNPIINNEDDVRFGIVCTTDNTSLCKAWVGGPTNLNNHKSVEFSIEDNVKYHFKLDKTGLSVNDTKYTMTDVGDYTGSWGACINSRHLSATTFSTEYSKGRWYYLKIYEDGKLVKHLIPVIDPDTNEVCMYDKVNKRYHVNIGTGTFISGGVKE